MTPTKTAQNVARAREAQRPERPDHTEEWEHRDVLAYVYAALGAAPHESHGTADGVEKS